MSKTDRWLLSGVALVMIYFAVGVIDGVNKVRAQEKVKICAIPQVPCSTFQVNYSYGEETISYITGGTTCNYFEMPSNRWLTVWIHECDSTMVWVGQWDGWMQSYFCVTHPIIGEGEVARQYIFKRPGRNLPTFK